MNRTLAAMAVNEVGGCAQGGVAAVVRINGVDDRGQGGVVVLVLAEVVGVNEIDDSGQGMAAVGVDGVDGADGRG